MPDAEFSYARGMTSVGFGVRSSTLPAMVQLGASAREIAAFLEALPAQKRLSEVLSLRGRQVARLYDTASQSDSSLSEEDLVPASMPVGTTITWEGRNSLAAFSHFQKRFSRAVDGTVFGYNYQLTPGVMRLTGPGYFLVYPGGRPQELRFDYTQAPPLRPAGWPEYRNNMAGLSRWVFGGLQDTVRKVAKGVVVGAAFREGKEQNAYFVLILPTPYASL